MPRNGSGTYTLPAGNPVVTGTTISSTVQNTTMADVATALSQSLSSDGQTVPTANLPMGGYKLTGLGSGTASADSAAYAQTYNQPAAASVASAATTNIGAAASSSVTITGTTTITAFDSVADGIKRDVTFSGALILTHNATSLILPGAANITTAAGDCATFLSLGSGNWRCIKYQNVGLQPIALRSYLSGLKLSTAGSSTSMSIAPGTATDSSNSALMVLSSSITKTTASWAVGTAAGGLDTGSIANSTWYHFHLIRRPDTGVVDVVFSLSASAPTLPSNYTQYRRIGSGLTNGSGQWTSFIQDGDFFEWLTPVLDVNVSAAGSSAVTRTLTVPTGVNLRALLNLYVAAGAGGEAILVSDLATTDVAAGSSSNSQSQASTTSSAFASAQATVRTNTSAQIRSRLANGATASEILRISTHGWYDTRGRDA